MVTLAIGGTSESAAVMHGKTVKQLQIRTDYDRPLETFAHSHPAVTYPCYPKDEPLHRPRQSRLTAEMTLASDTSGKEEMMNKAAVLLAASGAALALTVAGCSGSGDSKSSSSSSSNSNANPTLEKAVKYAQCMRENGVTNFPDPDKDGRFSIAAGGPNQNTPQFNKAKLACKSQEPPGIKDDPAQVAKAQTEWLKWSQCMRKNGVPDMPDPQDGRLQVPRDRINVNSPQFKNAMNACRSVHVGGSENGNG